MYGSVMSAPHLHFVMTAQEYILSTLKSLAEPVVPSDLSSSSLDDAILAKVMSKKFRKLKADDEAIKISRGAIKYAIKNKKPVTVGVLFGGNKLWRFDEAPEVDWAEFFSLEYYLEWMKSIASVYEYGAHFDYYSQNISVESLNNVPMSETEQYTKTFKDMLEWFRPYMPANVTVSYRQHADEYSDMSEYYAELEESKRNFLNGNNGNLPVLDEAQKAATELNVRLRPGQDNDPLWREKVEWEHQSIFGTKSLLKYLTDPTIIPTCPSAFPGLIATGSTKKSYAKFWAGVGALEKSDEGFHRLVLTPNQLQNAKFDWEDVQLDGLTGKNFGRIRIIRK
jgi:hypothetical protein